MRQKPFNTNRINNPRLLIVIKGSTLDKTPYDLFVIKGKEIITWACRILGLQSAVCNQWTGPLDWTTGLDYWTGSFFVLHCHTSMYFDWLHINVCT